MNNMRRLALSLALAVLSALPVLAAAQSSPAFAPLANYKGSSIGNYIQSGSSSLPDYLNHLFQYALSIGAILAVIRLVWAGYKYMSTDIWSKKGEAKTMITNALIGLLLLLGIYLILYQINPCILDVSWLTSGSFTDTCGGTG